VPPDVADADAADVHGGAPYDEPKGAPPSDPSRQVKCIVSTIFIASVTNWSKP
jgi:hypothetical protein